MLSDMQADWTRHLTHGQDQCQLGRGDGASVAAPSASQRGTSKIWSEQEIMSQMQTSNSRGGGATRCSSSVLAPTAGDVR